MKKEILWGAVLVFITLLVIGGYYFYQYQQREKSCLGRINYDTPSDTYSIGRNTFSSDSGLPLTRARYFKTQDEAMNYCMKTY